MKLEALTVAAPRVHSMRDSLAAAARHADAPWWDAVYRHFFPDLAHSQNVRDSEPQQRAGIDRVLLLQSGRVVRVDEKVREGAWPDFLLEYISVDPKSGGEQVPGWIAKDLECDFIAYAFVPTQECYLLPFLSLRRAWQAQGQTWLSWAEERERGYSLVSADNGRYITRCVAVPRAVLLQAISDVQYQRFYGPDWQPDTLPF